MSGFARRVLTGTALTLGVAGLLWADGRLPAGWMPYGCALGLGLLVVLELGRMGAVGALRVGPALLCALVACAVFTGRLLTGPTERLAQHHPGLMYAGLVTVAAAACLLGTFVVRPVQGTAGRGRPWALGLALWTLPPLFALVPLGVQFGTRGLVLLVVLSKIGDVFGYFVGRAIGRSHPFPRLSPGKTTAGCVASLAAGAVAGAALLPLLGDGATLLHGALAGAAVNVAAQAGDLAESWVKRRAGVKDSSAWVGPAGGVLDVVDSLLVTVPAGVFLWPSLV